MSKEFIYLLPDMQWKEIIKNTAPKIRDGLRSIVDESGGECVSVFYESLLQHKYAAQFLDKKMIEDRLRIDLLLWMKSLFSVREKILTPCAISSARLAPYTPSWKYLHILSFMASIPSSSVYLIVL